MSRLEDKNVRNNIVQSIDYPLIHTNGKNYMKKKRSMD